MRFCDKLAKQRKNSNLSQEQLADSLGVSRQAVSKWESGSSYPDMDKIIQMTKILNCTLEDLMDDGTISNTKTKEQKINFNNYLQEFLKLITKTNNMFSCMNFKEKIKCIIEMFFIVILLLCVGVITYTIISSISNGLLNILPYNINKISKEIFNEIYLIIILMLGIVIFIHLFKIRFLDYFITTEDKNVIEKTKEEPIEQKNVKRFFKDDKPKIIIRDPKHSSFSFFYLIGKIIFLFIKAFIIFFTIPVIIMFITFIFLLIISMCNITHGILFLFIMIVFL